MLKASSLEMKRLVRLIQNKFPGWQVVQVLSQEPDITVFRVKNGNQLAELHAVSFHGRRGEALQNGAPRHHWQSVVRTYVAWLQQLCGFQHGGYLLLPVSYAVVTSILHSSLKTVLVLQPEVAPLTDALGQPMRAAETARLFQALCSAVLMCRENGVPHSQLTVQNLFVRTDGSYCLGGMTAPELLEVFDHPMPTEAHELQHVAMLVMELMKEHDLADAPSCEAALTLNRLIQRASIGEKGLTFQRVISELNEIIAELKNGSPCSPKHAFTSDFRDVTYMFSESNDVRNLDTTIRCRQDQPGNPGSFATDLDRTIRVQSMNQPKQAAAGETNLDCTIGVRNAASNQQPRRSQSDAQAAPQSAGHIDLPDQPEDLERTLRIQRRN